MMTTLLVDARRVLVQQGLDFVGEHEYLRARSGT
jgi:hypothetical protein